MYVLQVRDQVVIRGDENAECLPSGNKVSAEPESNNLAKQVKPEKRSALKEKKVAGKVSYPQPHVKFISKHALSIDSHIVILQCNNVKINTSLPLSARRPRKRRRQRRLQHWQRKNCGRRRRQLKR